MQDGDGAPAVDEPSNRDEALARWVTDKEDVTHRLKISEWQSGEKRRREESEEIVSYQSEKPSCLA